MLSLENLPRSLAQIIIAKAEETAAAESPLKAEAMPAISGVQRTKELLRTLDQLPAAQYVSPILEILEEDRRVVVTGATGCGKSTELPLFAATKYPNTDVIVAVPRITAALRLAVWVSQIKGEQVGQSVGYHTGESRSMGPNTRLIYCTTGIAVMRELLNHKKRNRIVFVDEVHERHIDQDLLLAFLRKEMKTNTSLRVAVMSATIQADQFSEYLYGAKQVHIVGQGHEIIQVAPEATLGADIVKFVGQKKNIQVGAAGKREVYEGISEAEEALHSFKLDAVLLPLHRDVSPSNQQLCFRTDYPDPRVVISTNVAESSITLPENHVVIDTGLRRRVCVRNGVQSLETTYATQFEAMQLRGRTGRTGPGIWVDRCPVPLDRRPLAPLPEIKRVLPLSALLRCVALQGIDPRSLSLMDDPGPEVWNEAEQEGKLLGLLDSTGQATDFGKKVALLRLSPNFGRMLLAAHQERLLKEAIIVASAIEAEGLHDPANPAAWRSLIHRDTPESALSVQLRLFQVAQNLERNNDTDAAFEMCGIRRQNYKKAKVNAAETESRVREFGWTDLDSPSRCKQIDAALVRCFLAGFPNRVFVRIGGNYMGMDGEPREIHSQEYVSADTPFVVGIPLDFSPTPEEWGGETRHTINFACCLPESTARGFKYVRDILNAHQERRQERGPQLRAPWGRAMRTYMTRQPRR